MQSMFRAFQPWTRDAGGDKHYPVDKPFVYKTQQMKPNMDLSLTTQKRKRADSLSLNSSPVDAPQVKRQRKPEGGPVQIATSVQQGPELIASAKSTSSGLVKSSETNGSFKPVGHQVAPSMTFTWTEPNQALPPTGSNSNALSVSSPAQASKTSSKSQDKLSSSLDARPIATETVDNSMDANLDHVRAIVEAQINLEILLKHNELRLIEQELAKCQVALEQIRRCELIPYPGIQSASSEVSQGTGAVLQTRAGYTTPKHPAPFGVTDGPYTRHYAQWLLHDPMFESQAIAAPSAVSTGMQCRSTRNSIADFAPPTPVARTSRMSSGGKQLLAQDPSQPYRDPLLMKREQDNQWVRLICTKCKPERSNFQNIQGFLNHCRISHQDNYKSHEQAAIACGRIVEVDESMMPPPPPTVTKQRQSISIPPSTGTHVFKASSAASTPVVEKPQERFPTSVNPLVLSLPTDAGKTRFRELVLPRMFHPNAPKPEVTTPNIESPVGTPFTASPSTPYLSVLMKRKHEVGDLQAAVAEAKRKVDTSAYDCTDDEDDKSKRKRKSASGSASRRPQNRDAGKGKEGDKKPEHPQIIIRQPVAASTSQSTGKKAVPAMMNSSSFSQPSGDDDTDLSLGAVDFNPGLVSDHEGESDDADEDAEDSSSPPLPANGFTHHAPGLSHGQRTSCGGDNHADLMDVDGFIEIRDSSDGERDMSDAIHRSLGDQQRARSGTVSHAA